MSQEEILGLATQSLVGRRVEKDQERIGYSSEAHEQDREKLDWFTEAKRTDILNNPSSDIKLVYELCGLGPDNELPKRLDEKIEKASKEVLRHEIDCGIWNLLEELKGGTSASYVIATLYTHDSISGGSPTSNHRRISSFDPIGQESRRIETALLNEEQRQNLTTQNLNEAKEKLISMIEQRLDELGVSSYTAVVAHKDSGNPGYEYVTLLSTKGGVVAEALSDPVAVLRERARADFERFTATYNYKKHEKAQKTYEELEKKFPKTEDDRDKLYESSTTVLEMVIDNSIKDELERLLATLEHVSSLDSITPDSPE